MEQRPRQRGGAGAGLGAGAYLTLGGGHAGDLALHGGVGAAQVSAQQGLAVHLGLQTGDVAAAEVLAQLVHLLQLQQVDPQHLDGLHHLWPFTGSEVTHQPSADAKDGQLWGQRSGDTQLTRLSSSGSSLKNGFPSFSWQRTKFSMSTSKLAEVMQSELSVDCSHFSKSSASSGKSGCLQTADRCWYQSPPQAPPTPPAP